jgi:phage FluMu gp28-like protein
VYEIPWWFSAALCIDVRNAVKLAPRLTTKERVAAFGTEAIKNTFSSLTLEEFVQEYECGFVDDAGAYMSYELVQSCWEENYSDDPKDPDASMIFKKFEGANETEPGEEFWRWLRDNKRGMLEIGYDIARSGDLSALVAVDTIGANREVRAIVILKNASFALQEAMIDSAIRIARPVAFRYDNTSLGMATGESLARKWGSLFERISFTNTIKAEMATGLKLLFEKRQIRIPAWQILTDNIRSIQKGLTDKNKLVSFEADASDHHGDIYWAFALACLQRNDTGNMDYSTKGSRIITGGSVPI